MFKPIAVKGLEDYQISEDGTVANPQGIILSKTLTRDLRGKSYRLNKLVAETWVPKPSKKHIYILFKDRNPKNVHADNLYWATEEQWHRYKNRKNSKPVYQYTLSGELVEVHRNCQEAGKKMFGRPHNIGRVCRGEEYTYLGYIWSYKEITEKGISRHLKNRIPQNGKNAIKVAKLHPVTGEVLDIYNSIKIASEENYICVTSISRAVRTGIKAGNYYYKRINRNGVLVDYER